jgi:hypothetical protein
MNETSEDRIVAALGDILNECRQINERLDKLITLRRVDAAEASERQPPWIPRRDEQPGFGRYAKQQKKHSGPYKGPRSDQPSRGYRPQQQRDEPRRPGTGDLRAGSHSPRHHGGKR